MDVQEGIELFGKAFDKTVEGRIWQKWLNFYVHTDPKKRLPYDTYYQKHVGKSTAKKSKSNRTPEQIIAESKRIRNNDRERS
ncbi:hypothetical protein J2S74_002313 [Evansella vedderi]|uniref:Uncharacterized protein n=1 Tax=Evansella vedderi TaxID=38282 RepID=A0ABT9ZUL4_9BACI|nr:hypothetical protein [Evansella vedderi]